MKRRNILSLLLLVAFSVSSLFMSSFGATAELSSGLNGDVASDWISYGAEHIEGTRSISAVTGRFATTDTMELFDVGGTDLGIPFTYTYKNQEEEDVTELRILFGDTFSNEYLVGNWRSRVCYRTDSRHSREPTTNDGHSYGRYANRQRNLCLLHGRPRLG